MRSETRWLLAWFFFCIAVPLVALTASSGCSSEAQAFQSPSNCQAGRDCNVARLSVATSANFRGGACAAGIDFGTGANDCLYGLNANSIIYTPGVLESASGFITTLGTGASYQHRSAQAAGAGFTNPYYGATIGGTPTDDANGIGVRVESITALTNAAADVACFYNGTSLKACINLNGFFLTPIQGLNVSDNGAGSAAAATLTPTSQFIEGLCFDTHGCDITLSETGAQTGTEFTFTVNSLSTTMNFADTAGVSETSGALALGPNDAVRFIYNGSAWVQISAVQNN